MKKFKSWAFMMWRPIFVFLAVAAIVGCVFGFRLGSLTPAASPAEQQYLADITSGKQLVKNPLYIVHKVPVYGLFKFHVSRLAAYRAVSAGFATLAVVSCFFILREWYTDRIAILGTWLFLTSAWVLHVGRLATPEASYLLMMPLLWTAIWLYNTTLHKSAIMLLTLLSGLAFYIPGFGWLLIITAVWKSKMLWKELRQVPWWFVMICFFIFAGTLLPLAWAAYNNSAILLQAAGLPEHIPLAETAGRNLVNIASNLVWRGPDDATRWLGRLPLLDGFSAVMLVMGLYSMRYHLKLFRIQLLAGSSILLAVLIASGGPVTITALIPVVYILIAGGVAFMLQQWLTVFPRNPLARGTATTLISISILFVSFYHINHYFIAWPQSPATKATFSVRLPIR